jgi:hypothetical protein
MAAFLTCGNGRITLLKTVVHPNELRLTDAAAPGLTHYLLSCFSYH